MKKRLRKILLVVLALLALMVLGVALQPNFRTFLAMQVNSLLQAGTWEDDPGNWFRAFKEPPPAQVQVIHSKYWRSSHFTTEFIFYFEVKASAEWRDEFLKQKQLTPMPGSDTRTFRGSVSCDLTPDWFAPGPAGLYEAWSWSGDSGSFWINKTNGHVFLFRAEL